MKENENLSTTNEFQRLLGRTRYTFYAVFLFAFATNLLMLITPFYALQVLGRVIPTGSFQTLFVISFIVGIIYFIYSLITLARSYTLIKLAHWLDNMVGYVLFKHAIVVSSSKPNMRANNLMNDFKRFKSALTGVVTVIFDMPFACMYLFALYVINFKIFVWTLFAGLVIISLSVLNASITTSLLNEQSKLKMKADYSNMKALQNAKLVHAMGIISNVCDEWKEHHLGALGAQMSASYRNTFIMQLTALLRNWFQMGITILGAYSVIMSGATDMTVGMMIVCSILFGKFLGPFSQMLNTYKTATMAYFSYLTLDNFFSQYNEMQKVVKIPNTADLTGRLVVENVSFAVDQQKTLLSMFGPKIGPRYLLRDLNFTLEPGEFVGVIGEIGSGKSLAALIACGAIKPTTGRVTMDGIDVSKCDREQLGMHMGIAFQEPALFHVSVALHIAGLDRNYKLEDVVKAAEIAGINELIQTLPKGYETIIGLGDDSFQPSAGQAQLLALARAFYKEEKKKIYFLDEINANLDRRGNDIVWQAIKTRIVDQGKICFFITHRPQILKHVHKVIVIHKGKIIRIGKPDEIINSQGG